MPELAGEEVHDGALQVTVAEGVKSFVAHVILYAPPPRLVLNIVMYGVGAGGAMTATVALSDADVAPSVQFIE